MTNRLLPIDDTGNVEELARLLDGLDVVALTGAGCSTESGIPDYRGPETKRRTRNPIRYRDFVGTDEARARYWARSLVGWPKFNAAAPNEGHRALARLEQRGRLCGIITQNVDRLHHDAGSQNVVELHGALAEVVCLDCRTLESRDTLQARLREANPDFDENVIRLAPDGDADLHESAYADFRAPNCASCDSPHLKPNVVFFGENVPRDVVERAFMLVEDAEALLIVGSSLTVYSGLRFVKHATERRMPIAIVNLGETRGDDLAWLRLNGRSGEVLPRLADLLGC